MELWTQCSGLLESRLSSEDFNTWIKPLSAETTNNSLEIKAPNDFILNHVRENFLDDINDALNGIDPEKEIIFKTLDKSTFVDKLDSSEDRNPGLVQAFTFSTFVEGKSNHMALAAAKQVAQNPKGDYNPLFIYGGVGLGKTHLMHAVGNEILRNSPKKRIVYVHSEKFVADMVKALQLGAMSEFKSFYRNADALLIDDIQFFAGKEQSQEEFFHTFNALVDQGKQIIISADRAPGEIKGLEERIKSRLQCGLVVDLHPTNYELRLGILQSKVDMYSKQYPDLSFDPEVLEFLALRISTNVRVLEGALTRLFAFASLVGRHITLEVTQDCLADVLRASERKITIEEIQRKVSEHYNIRLSDMIGPKRLRTYARPRQIAMYLSKNLTSRSLPEIGRRFGGRDHTTVMHGVKRIEELKIQDGQVAEDVEILRRALEA